MAVCNDDLLGAGINLGDESRETPLVIAYRRRNLEAMQLLLEYGADPDVRYPAFGPMSHEA